ncbi:MAG TPA: GNAT family N-acetyltransferase [Gaiellaceae bacterium]|nr:GNAT family N-acetyltransferase [Gaiellaceae bacterium]
MFDVPATPLTFPDDGVRRDGLLFRLPTPEDIETIAPAFSDPDIGGRANMPALDTDTLRELSPLLPERMEQGMFMPLLVADSETGEILGGATVHQLNWELGQAEIGYWLFPAARGRGVATRTARFLAEHAFSLGIDRVEARVFDGNRESERVLQRAGFTREGVLRSLPKRDGGRGDMTLYSLLPGE